MLHCEGVPKCFFKELAVEADLAVDDVDGEASAAAAAFPDLASSPLTYPRPLKLKKAEKVAKLSTRVQRLCVQDKSEQLQPMSP